jgi:hypothetical protein
MSLIPKYTLEMSSDCGTLYFNDTTPVYSVSETGGYGAPNPTRASITSTILTLTDSSGNSYIYSGYLPTTTDGVSLNVNNFTPPFPSGAVIIAKAGTDTSDCGCGDSITLDNSSDNDGFADGCVTVNYALYQGATLVAEATGGLFFDCKCKNVMYDEISTLACSDACNDAVQASLLEVFFKIEQMEVVYEKAGCSCAESLLYKVNDLLSNIENEKI